MSIEERGEGQSLGDNDLSPTDRPRRQEPVMTMDDLANDLARANGVISALRQRADSLDREIKTLENKTEHLESVSWNRGTLLGRAVIYIQSGRDELAEDSKLRVEVSGLINSILMELQQTPFVFTGQLNADKFVDVTSDQAILTNKKDVYRMCLACGREISKDEPVCPQCYSKDDEARELSLTGKAQADILQKENRNLLEKIAALSAQITEDRNESQSISEVRVAGRVLERLNGMVTSLDTLIKDAEHVSSILTDELEDAKQTKCMNEHAIASHIEQQIAGVLAPFFHKE